jgi:glycosyltransferase involved in cell wall biosynthesis
LPVRILHIGNIGNGAFMTSRAQRRLGHASDVLVTTATYMDYPYDIRNYYRVPHLFSAYDMLTTVRIARRYDIVHVHSGFERMRLDNVGIKWLGIPLVSHYHGSDLRTGYANHWRSLPDYKIVSSPDLLRWCPEAEFMVNPFDASRVPIEPMPEGKPVILHCPSKRALKGTEKVIRASELLKKRGVEHEFRLVESVPHTTVLDEIGRSHIVVDQLGPFGLSGTMSLEAMSSERVAIAHLDPEYARYYPGLPVRSPATNDAEGLADLLEELIGSGVESLERIGREGRAYVTAERDPVEIAKRLDVIYSRLLRR